MNKYDIAALAAINGLDDWETRKLSAKQQRELFGFVICGRKDISFNPEGQGIVRIGRSVVPNDYVCRDYSYEAFAERVNNREIVEAW